MDAAPRLVHATAVAMGSRAVLIRGPSGAGKSDLALRCLGLTPSALISESPRLVADDQVLLERCEGRIMAAAPPNLARLIEVRGIGVVELSERAWMSRAGLALVADLRPRAPYERMPEPRAEVLAFGLSLPVMTLDPFEISAPLKLMLALAQA